MHNYSVALRICGKDLDLAEVSATLKLNPTQTRLIGQPRSPKSVWLESMWEYEARPGEDKIFWNSLEDGLRQVVAVFVSRKSGLRKYQRRFKVFLWCGHFSSSFDGGPTLSPTMLKALSGLGVQLILETHFSGEPSVE
jgi:hypothetical protein